MIARPGSGLTFVHELITANPSYRVDKSRSRETQGTGLRLAIVKHVLLRHRATLTNKSEAGKGSCFTVSFPRR